MKSLTEYKINVTSVLESSQEFDENTDIVIRCETSGEAEQLKQQILSNQKVVEKIREFAEIEANMVCDIEKLSDYGRVEVNARKGTGKVILDILDGKEV